MALFGGFYAIALAEFVNSSGSIYEFLFAGVERMAFCADRNFHFFFSGVSFPNFSTGANEFCLPILRMEIFFHLV